MIWIRQELMEMTTWRCHLGYVSGTWCPKSSEENSYSSQNTSDIRPDYVANITTENRLHTQVKSFVFVKEIFKIDILFHCGVYINVWSGIPIDNDTKFDKTATDLLCSEDWNRYRGFKKYLSVFNINERHFFSSDQGCFCSGSYSFRYNTI